MVSISHEESGFSIVELMVTIVTIGIIFGAFITTFTTIQNINKKASDIQNSNIIAFAKVQEYENRDFSSLPETTPYGTWNELEDFSSEIPNSVEQPRTGKVLISSVSPTLKQIGVEVEYGNGASKQKVTYISMIQASGVGR